jgi:hypothetical protein
MRPLDFLAAPGAAYFIAAFGGALLALMGSSCASGGRLLSLVCG